MWQPLEIFDVLNILTLKRIFWKTKTFFEKREYFFLVESTKIETETFPYKTDLSEAILGQVEWGVQNGPITKNRVLPVSTLFYWKFCFSLRTSFTNSSFDVLTTQMSISILFISAGVLFEGVFSL